jgi:hypothetical protein
MATPRAPGPARGLSAPYQGREKTWRRDIWRFELHPAWNLKRRVSGSSAGNAAVYGSLVLHYTKEPFMGLGKKAKNKAKAVKGKTKKDAGKVKHKGKKAKNAAKH